MQTKGNGQCVLVGLWKEEGLPKHSRQPANTLVRESQSLGAAPHPVSLFPPLCVPQVKQIMEEAVTRKFVHEDSSHIISFCGEW